MNNASIWIKLGKNFRYYLGFLFLLLVSNMLFFFLIEWNNRGKVNIGTYLTLDDYVYKAYDINPEILNFDEEGTAILMMDTLMLGVSNEEESVRLINRAFTRSFDQCVGYIVVEKTNEENVFKIDKSHICDMVD